MRGEPQVVGGGDRAEPHTFRDAARDREVGLQHVRGAQLGDLAEVVAGELALAGRDRHCGGAAYLGEAGLIVGRHRLLEPVEVAVLDHPAERLRLRHRPRAVGVGHQLHVGAERLARGAHPRRGAMRLAVHHADAHLDGAEPALRHVAEQLLADAGLVGPAPRGVRGHALGAAPAEQAPDGRAERFAEEVPERDVDAGDRRDREAPPPELGQHVAAIEREALSRRVVHHVPQPAHVARVLPDEEGRQVAVDDGGEAVPRCRAADAGLRLAPAHEAVVRLHLHEDGVEGRDATEVAHVLPLVRDRDVDPGRPEARDLHRASRSVTAGRLGRPASREPGAVIP